MAKTRVSSKYQVVIPKEIRDAMALKPGQDLQVVRMGDMIVLAPDRPLAAYRGILRGLPVSGFREKKDRV